MKKTLSLIGILTGIAVIIFALCILFGAFSKEWSVGGYSSYDSGYANFGADYYTYSVNNSAETTTAVRAAARNIGNVYELLELCVGCFMLFFGIMSVCGFGMVFADCTSSPMVNKKDESPVISNNLIEAKKPEEVVKEDGAELTEEPN